MKLRREKKCASFLGHPVYTSFIRQKRQLTQKQQKKNAYIYNVHIWFNRKFDNSMNDNYFQMSNKSK